MKQGKLLEKNIKQELDDFFQSLGSKRYFGEVVSRGHEFVAKLWVEKNILDKIAEDKEKIKMISKAIRKIESKFETSIFEELKILF